MTATGSEALKGLVFRISNSPSALRASVSFQRGARRAGRRGTPEGRLAPPCYIQVNLQTRRPPFGRLARSDA